MTEYKIIFGYLSILVAIIGYIPYFHGTLTGKIKPHAFSWLIWSLLGAIIFAAQVVKHGGAGSWVTGFTALVCFIIFLLALVKGDRQFVSFDWSSLVTAFIAIFLWRLTNEPTLSVILVSIADFLGFLPTFRKGYNKPFEDTTILWSLTTIKWVLSIVALGSYSLVTLLYPTYLIIANGCFVILLLWRRRQKI